MSPLKKFEEFLETGTARKISPDIARAKSLIEEADERKRFICEIKDKIGLNNSNANYFIENSYDALMELIRAKLLIKGIKTSGEGAHEAEVAFMEKMEFSEADIRFMNDLRFYRNGILYYGKKFDEEYARKVLKFMDKAYPKIKNAIDK